MKMGLEFRQNGRNRQLDSVPYEAMASLLQRQSNSGEYTDVKLTAVLAIEKEGQQDQAEG